LHCIALRCIAMNCISPLQCSIALNFIALHCAVLYGTVLYYIPWHCCIVPCCIALCCIALGCIAVYTEKSNTNLRCAFYNAILISALALAPRYSPLVFTKSAETFAARTEARWDSKFSNGGRGLCMVQCRLRINVHAQRMSATSAAHIVLTCMCLNPPRRVVAEHACRRFVHLRSGPASEPGGLGPSSPVCVLLASEVWAATARARA
jgi:hypothetical protein